MELQRYYDVSQAADPESFKARLVAMAHELDFPLIAAALVCASPSTKGESTVHMVGNTPQAFIDASWHEDAFARDPVLKRMKTLSVPFTYDQALYVREGAADLWEEQAVFGFKTGISVALHLPDHRHFVLGVDREVDLPNDSVQLTRMMADLQLLAVHAQDAAVRLLLPAREAPPVRLTPREIEILRWSLDGKSAWAVGEILGLSEHTINFHMRNAFRKLNASSKTQAVLKAVSLGLL